MSDEDPVQRIASENGYTDLKIFRNGDDAAIMRLVFTHAIISGLTSWGYENRWCYKTYDAAKEALEAWNGDGEPDGWHRHPGSGRRRENGIETIYF